MSASQQTASEAAEHAGQKPAKPGSKAESAQIRKGSNWINMIIALAACMLVVVFAVSMAPKGNYTANRTVDVTDAAAQAKGTFDFDLYVPDLPKGWKANEAGDTKFGDPAKATWYVSMHGKDDAWVTVRQADADDTWAESLEDDAAQVGRQEVSGVTFKRLETPKGKQLLTAKFDHSELALVGTASWDDFGIFAKQAVHQLKG